MISSGKMQRKILIGLSRSVYPSVKQSFLPGEAQLHWMSLNPSPILLWGRRKYGDWHPNRPTGGKYANKPDKEWWRIPNSPPWTTLQLQLLKITKSIPKYKTNSIGIRKIEREIMIRWKTFWLILAVRIVKKPCCLERPGRRKLRSSERYRKVVSVSYTEILSLIYATSDTLMLFPKIPLLIYGL